MLNSFNSPRYFALIPAAGIGARMAAHCPKQYIHIAGKSMLQHSVTAFLQHRQITHVFVVVSRDDEYVSKEIQSDPRLSVLFCGGDVRSDSVMNGLLAMQAQQQLSPQDWVLVHDAARPGLTPGLISRLIDAVGMDDVGGLLALPVVDTVKLQTPDARVKTIPRAGLWLAQTPQLFRHGQLLAALNNTLNKAKNGSQENKQKNEHEITDEASAIEMLGLTPKLVEGHWCNTKITHPDDAVLIEAWLKNE